MRRSFGESAPFMTILRCQLWQTAKERNVSLLNNTFVIRYVDGTTHTEKLKTIEEIEHIIEKEFELPKLPVREAVACLAERDINIFARKE